jgi:tRNA-Thr(GGU) m(6)t(6)A37 methyltransferase TsaA
VVETPGTSWNMKKGLIDYYQKTWKDYDEWYDKHPALYGSELAALKKVVPSGIGLEIGVGTGRFAAPLQVRYGLDPARKMLKLAQRRGIKVVQGLGERLPFKEESFDFVQIVFVIEFVDHLFLFLKEAARVLRREGTLILGFIDKDSQWGQYYARRPRRRRFFYPPAAKEIQDILKALSMESKEAFQTLFQPPPEISVQEEPKSGFGEGGFVIFKAIKTREKSLLRGEPGSMEIKFKAIGMVHSPYKRNKDIDVKKFADPHGFDRIRGSLEIFKEYEEGLADTEGFSHLMVITVFHKSRGYELRTKPFLDDELRGVFSTRSPRRPNPLGLTVVRVLKREGNILKVSGIDMLDGTPILDIKPYTPRDQKSPIRLGWLGNKMKGA